MHMEAEHGDAQHNYYKSGIVQSKDDAENFGKLALAVNRRAISSEQQALPMLIGSSSASQEQQHET